VKRVLSITPIANRIPEDNYIEECILWDSQSDRLTYQLHVYRDKSPWIYRIESLELIDGNDSRPDFYVNFDAPMTHVFVTDSFDMPVPGIPVLVNRVIGMVSALDNDGGYHAFYIRFAYAMMDKP
jgi:hypothetical protein